MDQLSQFFKERSELEKPVYAALYEEFMSEIPSHLHGSIRYFSFLMLKPDVYISALGSRLLDLLKEHEVVPIRARTLWLDEGYIDELYKFVKQKYFDTWWVMKRAYTLAPCTPLMIVGRPGSFLHLSERLRDIVGPTTPIVGSARQIRYGFRATHRVFNLIHGTDDPASAIREALVFFSWDDIGQALELADNIAKDQLTIAPALAIDSASVGASDQPRDIRFGSVKADVKTKVCETLAALVDDLPEGLKTSHTQSLRNVQEGLAQERSIVEKNLELRREREELLAGPLYLQAIIVANWQRVCASQMEQCVRQDCGSADKRRTTARLKQIADALFCLSLLIDDVKFAAANVELLLGQLADLNIDLSREQETIIHTGWAVAPQEARDFVAWRCT